VNPVKIYLSSSIEDQFYRKKLIVNLAGLKRQGKIKILNDTEILPGIIWENQIKQWLKEAEMVLFLVSSDFIASDFIYDIEIKKTQERKDEVKIIPIIIRPCDYDSLPIHQFKILPLNKIPVSLWENEDEAWLQILLQLKKIVEAINDEKINAIPEPVSNAKNTKSIIFIKLVSKLSIAAILLLFLSCLFIFERPFSNEFSPSEIAAKYFEPYPGSSLM